MPARQSTRDHLLLTPCFQCFQSKVISWHLHISLQIHSIILYWHVMSNVIAIWLTHTHNPQTIWICKVSLESDPKTPGWGHNMSQRCHHFFLLQADLEGLTTQEVELEKREVVDCGGTKASLDLVRFIQLKKNCRSSDLKIWCCAIHVAHPAYPWQANQVGKISDKVFMIFAIKSTHAMLVAGVSWDLQWRNSWNHFVVGWTYESFMNASKWQHSTTSQQPKPQILRICLQQMLHHARCGLRAAPRNGLASQWRAAGLGR